MKKILSILLVVAMLCTACFALASCGDREEEGKTIKIGLIGPMTGQYAVYGTAVRDAVMLAVEEINASDAILDGYTLEIVIKDDTCDATVGAQLFTDLASDEDIAAIIGPVTTGVTAASTALANDFEIVMVTPTATGDTITTESDYVFRACYKDSFQGTQAAKYAKELGYDEVGVLYATGDVYSQGLADAFKADCADLGIAVKTEKTTSSIDDTDFSSSMAQIKNDLGEEGFLFAPYYYNVAGKNIIPQARAAGYNGVIMGVDGYDGIIPDNLGADKTVYHDIYFTNHYAADSTEQVVKDFIAGYKAKYDGAVPNALAALGYDAAYMLAEAIDKVVAEDGNVDSAELKAAMDGMSFEGVTGDFTLDETGTPAKSVTIIEVKYDPETEEVTQGYKTTLK